MRESSSDVHSSLDLSFSTALSSNRCEEDLHSLLCARSEECSCEDDNVRKGFIYATDVHSRADCCQSTFCVCLFLSLFTCVSLW